MPSSPSAASQGRATLIGMAAIPIWAGLALLTSWAARIPPFQLVAMSFFIAACVGALMVWKNGAGRDLLRPHIPALLLGVSGLFGNHFFFFLALRNAPVMEATLINYLWPLLVVLFSALLPASMQGSRLAWQHVAGGLMGLAGAALVVLSGSSADAASGGDPWPGFAAALAAAVIWAGYSVASRLFSHVPTHMVALYCLITSMLALAAHLLFEQTRWPLEGVEWLAVPLLGLGPVGGAFYFWDYGMKRGDVRLLGVFSYMTPLLSLLLLSLAAGRLPQPVVWLAAALIIGGALLAARGGMMGRAGRAGGAGGRTGNGGRGIAG